MKFLFDVNALLALAHHGHALHSKTVAWYVSVLRSATVFYTCSITEIGFVRVSVATALQTDIETAKKALQALKSSSKVSFKLLPDSLGADQLPAFVQKPQQITDGHLFQLARKNGAQLVTLDRGIPGALLIS